MLMTSVTAKWHMLLMLFKQAWPPLAKGNINACIKYKPFSASTQPSKAACTAHITSTHSAQTQCNISLPLSLYRHILSREMPHNPFSHRLCQHQPHQTWVSILSFSSRVQPFQQCVARLNSKHDYLLVIIPYMLCVSIATYHFPLRCPGDRSVLISTHSNRCW